MMAKTRRSDVWLSSRETSDALGVTVRTVYKFIDDGLLPAYKMGRVLRVKRVDVEAFVESTRVEPGSLARLVARREKKFLDVDSASM